MSVVTTVAKTEALLGLSTCRISVYGSNSDAMIPYSGINHTQQQKKKETVRCSTSLLFSVEEEKKKGMKSQKRGSPWSVLMNG